MTINNLEELKEAVEMIEISCNEIKAWIQSQSHEAQPSSEDAKALPPVDMCRCGHAVAHHHYATSIVPMKCHVGRCDCIKFKPNPEPQGGDRH